VRIRDEAAAEELQINLTPLIDVVFMLLIFFMVATTFLDPEREMDVELPQAETGAELEADPLEIVINVAAAGRVVMGGEELDRDALRAKLERAASRNPDTPVTIRGDGRAQHQHVVGVMDVCGLAGLVNLSVGTIDAR